MCPYSGRSAKVRCDGKLPACTACEKAGRELECSSANDQFARGKERSYVAALELRIEKLHRRLNFARSRMASVSHHEPLATVTPQDRKDSLALIKAAIHRKAAKKRENSDVNSLVSDFGFLSVNATTRDFEPVSNMTFARLVLAAATNELLPMPDSNGSLPSRQQAMGTIQYYMRHIYPLLPSFSETSLINVLNDMCSEAGPLVSSHADRCILILVLAVGSLAQSKSRDDAYYTAGVKYVAEALVYADQALAPGYPSHIQCLLLLTQYAMLDPAHFDSWLLIGFASRAVVDLGFHQELPPKAAPDKATLDMRRRIFYCIYALDRAISMVHARPFSFTDSAVNVAFPAPSQAPSAFHQNGPHPSQQAQPALLHFQLRRAQSHWYQDLCQSRIETLPDPLGYIWRMCRDMREWNDQLPSTLPSAVRELFDLEIRYSYVYCIGAKAQLLTDYGRMLIFDHAIAYLETIYRVVHSPENSAFYTYHDALKVYFMASQLVAVLRDAEDLLLSDLPVPLPPPTSSHAVPPPPIPPRRVRAPGDTNLSRSLRCLEGVPRILRRWGERWTDALKLGESFELVFDQITERLHMRSMAQDAILTERGASPTQSGRDEEQGEQQQQQQQHQQQQQQQHQQQHQQPSSDSQLPPLGPGHLRHANSAGLPAIRPANMTGSPGLLKHQNSMGPSPSLGMSSPGAGATAYIRPVSRDQLTLRQISAQTRSHTVMSPHYSAVSLVQGPLEGQTDGDGLGHGHADGSGQWIDMRVLESSPQQPQMFQPRQVEMGMGHPQQHPVFIKSEYES